jgi:acetoin utilization deacetylase AcuC-like enzyme
MKTNDAMTIIWSDLYQNHATGSHPERPERIASLKLALDEAGLFESNRVVAPVPASVESVDLVHDPRLAEFVRQLAASGGGWLDPDTYVSPASYDVALLAVGGVTQALAAALTDGPSFAFVRPPGHHAEPGRAMGFCLFNNVAVAVEQIRRDNGIERVTILDWDVHHGNGTQAAFWSNPSVQFISLHQYPFYPGTGAANETGSEEAEGTTINIPLRAGSDDAVYRQAFEDRVLPSIREFEPEMIVVSAGFDAHADDPLANMRVSTEGFRWMAQQIADLALDVSGGRLALALEGGYNLQSLGASAVAVVEEIRTRYGIGDT